MILADENIPKPFVDALRRAGYDVLWVGETVRKGSSGDDIIALANSLGADLITRNKEFFLRDLNSTHLNSRLVLISDTIKSDNMDSVLQMVCEALDKRQEKCQMIEKGEILNIVYTPKSRSRSTAW
jgi:predicted nuclease of predicted toxin-antitoxin system